MSKLRDLSRKQKIIIIIVLVLVGCLIFAVGRWFYAFSKAFDRQYNPDVIISSSPDGQYELVAREWGFGMGGGIEIYIRKPGQEKGDSSSEEQYIGDASTDDGYSCFTRGNYYVEWESNKVTIYYYGDFQVEDVNDPSTWLGVLSYEFD